MIEENDKLNKILIVFNKKYLLSVLILVFCFQFKLVAQIEIVKKPILLLGTFHMNDANADQFNLKSDNIMSTKRQSEIVDVVKKLSYFKPTKVAIEAPYGDSITQANYHSYVIGNYELRKNESEQIGFRLAKMLGHDSIYPIDNNFKLNSDSLGKLVGSNPKFGKLMHEMQDYGESAIKLMKDTLNVSTISKMFYFINRPEILNRAHEIYLRYFIPITTSSDYSGSDFVAQWYKRNLRIFSNIYKITNKSNDRVLVIIGQGHIPILMQLTKEAPYFDLNDLLAYLK